MKNHSTQRMKFVLYSTKKLFIANGEGFWSNSDGWVNFNGATQFALDTIQTCNIPLVEGSDAKWMMWDPSTGTYGDMTRENLRQSSPPG